MDVRRDDILFVFVNFSQNPPRLWADRVSGRSLQAGIGHVDFSSCDFIWWGDKTT